MVQRGIAGTWELAQYSGYPFNQPLYPPGNGQIIILGADGSFERKDHSISVFRGNYQLTEKEDCHARENTTIISTNENSWDDYQYIQAVDGRLALSTPNCLQDGGTVYYRRLE